ncbi:hypothetical protein NIES4071_109980 (plasmid) [Calothrix sp. NIES-4071]|nr:hypothetical protein NIES4071_109980 [Calothrix sp. NIES-4071]BAZ65237.1 hypothetical protein NIES4105_109700 [Calothrix sp. NIES-4105]
MSFLTSKKQGKKKSGYKDLPEPTVRVSCGGLLEQRLELGEYFVGTAEELEQLKARVRVNADGSKTYLIPMLRPGSQKLTDEELMEQMGKPSNEIGFFEAVKRLNEKAEQGLFEVIK